MQSQLFLTLKTLRLSPKALGPRLARSGQHDIFAYGAQWVVKVPRKSLMVLLGGIPTVRDVVTDLALLERYFPEFLVPTQIRHTSALDYVIVQERLHALSHVTPEIAHSSQAFMQLWRRNNELVTKHHRSLDILGNIGWRVTLTAILTNNPKQARLNNVVLSHDFSPPQLIILDTNLLNLRAPLDWLRYQFSCWLLRKTFFSH